MPNSAPAGGDPLQSFICLLSGRTRPFSDAQVAALYATSAAYVAHVRGAANRAVDAGFGEGDVLEHAGQAGACGYPQRAEDLRVLGVVERLGRFAAHVGQRPLVHSPRQHPGTAAPGRSG